MPGIWQFSGGIEQEILKRDTLEVSYVGSRAFNQDSQDDINHWPAWYQATCNIEMGGVEANCENPAGYVANPFQGISAFNGSSYYSAPTIPLGNLYRPYKGFGSVIEYQLNDTRTWYNSLQVTGVHRQGKLLTLHGTWTWSKLMGTGGYSDTVYRIKSRWLDGNDFTHRITISGVYQLPVGRGRALLGRTNRIVDAAVGGWELSSLYIYQTGNPWGTAGSLEYLHNAKVPRTVEKTSNYSMIRGVNGCIASTNQYTGVHTAETNDWTATHTCSQFDMVVRPTMPPISLSPTPAFVFPAMSSLTATSPRTLHCPENLKLQLRLEGFQCIQPSTLAGGLRQ